MTGQYPLCYRYVRRCSESVTPLCIFSNSSPLLCHQSGNIRPVQSEGGAAVEIVICPPRNS